MTTKEKVIRESIAKAEKELVRIKAILDVNPYAEILSLEGDAIARAKAAKRPTDALRILKEAASKKTKLLAIAKKQQNAAAMINRASSLTLELMNLNRELYFETKQYLNQ